MREGALTLLLLVGIGVFSHAQAPQAIEDLQVLSKEDKAEFQTWLIHRGRTLDIPFPFINEISIGMADKPVKTRIYVLESYISSDDFKVLKYLDLMEKNARKNRRLNPYDRALLAAMKMFGMRRKQNFLDRFNRFTGEQGIEVKPIALEGAASAAAASRSGRRYDPETGLFEPAAADK